MSFRTTVRSVLFATLLLAGLAAPPLQAQPACIDFEPRRGIAPASPSQNLAAPSA